MPDRVDVARFLRQALDEQRNGWSIGTFGAIGEFVRDLDEPVEAMSTQGKMGYVTGRGGIGLASCAGLSVLAYDTLAGDGETWGQSVAFCLPYSTVHSSGCVGRIGADSDALREADRNGTLYDLGVGVGHVAMHIRTEDTELLAALNDLKGKPFLSLAPPSLRERLLQISPSRVLTSPVGRIEVYAPIPPPGGTSPSGPHTHLLPKLIASRRTHSANAPIPEGLQPVLALHPRSPWRDADGRRTPFDAELDEHFQGMLVSYGLEEDWLVRRAVEKAVNDRVSPDEFAPPGSRRGRAQLRITLRRLAHRLGKEAVAEWRARYDPSAPENDEPSVAGHA